MCNELWPKLVSNISDVENDIVWFVGTYYSAVFQLDLKTMECRLFAEFTSDLRMVCYRYFYCCTKYEDNVLVFPCLSNENIKVINTKSCNVTQIKIDNIAARPVGIMGVYKYCLKLYAVAIGLNAILEIDVNNLKIINTYSFHEEEYDVHGNCYFHGKMIYIFWENSNKILEFNLESKCLKKYCVLGMEKGIYTFGVIKDKFCLASVDKKLYLWDKEKNEISNTLVLPKGYGYYMKGNNEKYYLDTKYDMGVTLDCVEMGERLWMVSHEGNYIMVLSPEDVEPLMVFDIGEDNTVITDYVFSAKKYALRYSVIYIRENRYIGLFSFLSNTVYEIDTYIGTFNKLDIYLDKVSERIIGNRYYLFEFRYKVEMKKNDFELMISQYIKEYYDKIEELEECCTQINKKYTVGEKIIKLMK